ncbi:14770_t:CDS:2, partial [Gigaspora margarita]
MPDLSEMLGSYEVYEETSKQKESCVTKLKRVISLLIAIKVAFLYAFINAIISAIITALYMATDIKLTIKPDFITLISFIVSLLLSSRASNAYNRYIEGHSTWLKIRHTVFNMAKLIRINITDPKKRKEYTNLLLYFVITLKDYFVIEFKHKRNKDENKEDENSNGDINVTINNEEFEVKERENVKEFMKNIN